MIQRNLESILNEDETVMLSVTLPKTWQKELLKLSTERSLSVNALIEESLKKTYNMPTLPSVDQSYKKVMSALYNVRNKQIQTMFAELLTKDFCKDPDRSIFVYFIHSLINELSSEKELLKEITTTAIDVMAILFNGDTSGLFQKIPGEYVFFGMPNLFKWAATEKWISPADIDYPSNNQGISRRLGTLVKYQPFKRTYGIKVYKKLEKGVYHYQFRKLAKGQLSFDL